MLIFIILVKIERISWDNPRVQVFDNDGNFLTQFGKLRSRSMVNLTYQNILHSMKKMIKELTGVMQEYRHFYLIKNNGIIRII